MSGQLIMMPARTKQGVDVSIGGYYVLISRRGGRWTGGQFADVSAHVRFDQGGHVDGVDPVVVPIAFQRGGDVALVHQAGRQVGAITRRHEPREGNCRKNRYDSHRHHQFDQGKSSFVGSASHLLLAHPWKELW